MDAIMTEHGFGLLSDLASISIFLYFAPAALAKEAERCWEHPVFNILSLGVSVLIVAYSKYGTPGMFLSKRVERNVGVSLCMVPLLLRLLGYRARCPDDPLPYFPFMVFPGKIVDVFLFYGPVSMLLLPVRRIYGHYKYRGDAATFVSKLLVLLAIDVRLYVYCKYQNEKYNYGTKLFTDDSEGSFTVKLTIETLEVVIPKFLIHGLKWAFILEVVTYFLIPASLVAVVIAMRYARHNQIRARQMFLG